MLEALKFRHRVLLLVALPATALAAVTPQGPGRHAGARAVTRAPG
jgi:hypothetical protein